MQTPSGLEIVEDDRGGGPKPELARPRIFPVATQPADAAAAEEPTEATKPVPTLWRPNALAEPTAAAAVPEAPPRRRLPDLRGAIVTAYKVIGFAVLTVVLLGLVSYLGTSLFYLVCERWVEPTVVSPSDERVLALNAQLAQHAAERDRLLAELRDADRLVAMQERFQARFKRAIEVDLGQRQAELQRLRSLNRGYQDVRRRIDRSSRRYAHDEARRLRAEVDASLVDREGAVSGAYHLAQIAQAGLSVVEREADLEARADGLEKETRALASALRREDDGSLSYAVLRIDQEYERSVLETDRARDGREALKQSLARYERILASIKRSPWLRASEREATVAFVPYDNRSALAAGAPLYDCALKMLWCHRVGTVGELLPGEVTMKHPHGDDLVRGQMVEIVLDEVRAAEKPVLFVGGAPLLL